jgi:hypothetical protein
MDIVFVFLFNSIHKPGIELGLPRNRNAAVTHIRHKLKKLHAKSYIRGCRLYTHSPLTNANVLEGEMSHEYCHSF